MQGIDVEVDASVSRTLAILALRTATGTAALQRIVDPLRESALQQMARLTELPRSARASLEATWLAAVRAAVAPGLRYVHRDWIEAGLAVAPSTTRAALAGGVVTPATVWLARWFCAALPTLPPLLDDSVPLRRPLDVVALSAPRLLHLVTALGADGVVHALGAPALQGFDASKLGENRPLLQAAVARAAQPQPWPRGLRRRIVAWLTTVQQTTTGGVAAPLLLPLLGVQMLATVATIDRAQLAAKLPRAIGHGIWPGPWQESGHAVPTSNDLDALPWSIVLAAAA